MYENIKRVPSLSCVQCVGILTLWTLTSTSSWFFTIGESPWIQVVPDITIGTNYFGFSVQQYTLPWAVGTQSADYSMIGIPLISLIRSLAVSREAFVGLTFYFFTSKVNTAQECHCWENSPAPESAAQYRWSWVSPALPALCSLGNAMDTSEILRALLGITVHWPFQAISWPHLATLTFQCICPVSITKNYMTVADWR